jgi:site-specific DNA-methyltransferase (adenine-specific)
MRTNVTSTDCAGGRRKPRQAPPYNYEKYGKSGATGDASHEADWPDDDLEGHDFTPDLYWPDADDLEGPDLTPDLADDFGISDEDLPDDVTDDSGVPGNGEAVALVPPAAIKTPSYNRIIYGDCLDWLLKIPKGVPRLAFADPPFNIGLKYDSHDDNLPDDEYLDFSRKWIKGIYDALSPDGSFYMAIHGPHELDLCVMARDIGFYKRSRIIWHYGFGQAAKKGFTPSYTPIYYFVKDPKNFTFNADAIRVPSARQMEYNDSRANPKGKSPNDVWVLQPRKAEWPLFAAEGDAWLVSRVCGSFHERVKWHPCQMPLDVLDRIILASSDPGDVVLDPFSGSGTTCIAAAMRGRQYLGIEKSKDYVTWSNQRIAEALTKKAGTPAK